MLPVTIVTEGITDVPVLARVLELAGCSIHVSHGQRGKVGIDKNLGGYNSAARFSPWVVLRDLDSDATCAAEFVSRILPVPSQWMRFRVAVRATESWLLADAETLSEYLRVRRAIIPADPDRLADPKATLVNIARQSRAAAIRLDMVPEAGMTSRVGPAYSSRVTEFARKRWRPEVARDHSESLRRCIERALALRDAFENQLQR